MFDHPWLVRVCSGAGEKWFSDEPVSSLGQVFRAADREHSTYRVESDIDEAVAVAAHQIASVSQKLDTVHALRIRYLDLEETGIAVHSKHLGETGVVKVDHAHRDLVGDRQRIDRLVSLLRQRSFEGEDRIRRFNRFQLQLAIERILAMAVEERPTHTAELCEILLKRRTQPTGDQDLALSELAAARIPDAAIELAAYQRCEQRTSGVGSPVGDWFEALALLRDSYRAHYLASHFVDH